jgi:CBS domain-containing protein
MRPVRELLKSHDTPWSLKPQDSVFDALKILADHNVGALMVMDQGKLVGILSERDYTRKIALEGKSSKDTRVADIMTVKVLSVNAESRTEDCMAMMSQKKIRHMPVVDGDKVLGMISIRDIMDEIIADQEATINQLQSYIAS